MTWILLAATLMVLAAESYLFLYQNYIVDQVFETPVEDAYYIYTCFFYFKLAAIFYNPIYALWIFGMTRRAMDVKFITRCGSRVRWLAFYLRLSVPLALTFLAILNLWAIVGASAVVGGFSALLPYYLFCFLLQFLVLMTFSLVYFLVYVLTDQPVVAFLAMVLYGAWDAFYGLLDIPDRQHGMKSFNLYITWGRIQPDTLAVQENGMSEWLSFFLLLGIFVLILALCLIAVLHKDFIGVQENARKE
ncbi:MAG: hypothetical protein E6593_14430 [Clostridium sp.]|nr:hypothetical protein [Clostridium sp.]